MASVPPGDPGAGLAGPASLESGGGEACKLAEAGRWQCWEAAAPAMPAAAPAGVRPLPQSPAASSKDDKLERATECSLPSSGSSDEGGHHPALRYCYLAAWVAVLFAGYGLQRAWCACGIPYDCTPMDYLVVYQDLWKVALLGGAAAWYCRLTEPRRFFWLFSWRRWYAWGLYLALPPAYSAICSASFARHSLANVSDWSAGMIVGVSIVAALALAAWAAHLWLAKRRDGWGGFGAYLLARLLPYAFFAASAVALTSSGVADMHLHHLYLGWAAAIWAEFDHWASATLLAAGAAVFVQGAGAYSIESIFGSTACFTTKQADHLACAFWEPGRGANFSLQVCATGGRGLPTSDCDLWN